MTADLATNDAEALLDAMIDDRPAAQGKRLVDDAQIARFRKAIGDLNDVLRDVGV